MIFGINTTFVVFQNCLKFHELLGELNYVWQFRNITRGIYAKYHYKSCYYLKLFYRCEKYVKFSLSMTEVMSLNINWPWVYGQSVAGCCPCRKFVANKRRLYLDTKTKKEPASINWFNRYFLLTHFCYPLGTTTLYVWCAVSSILWDCNFLAPNTQEK